MVDVTDLRVYSGSLRYIPNRLRIPMLNHAKSQRAVVMNQDAIALQKQAHMFAFAANLCYTVTDVKNRASKRGCHDRFLVSIPLGAHMSPLAIMWAVERDRFNYSKWSLFANYGNALK
jgi:hypothetical protein